MFQEQGEMAIACFCSRRVKQCEMRLDAGEWSFIQVRASGQIKLGPIMRMEFALPNNTVPVIAYVTLPIVCTDRQTKSAQIDGEGCTS